MSQEPRHELITPEDLRDEAEEAKERPIKRMVWENPPKNHPTAAIGDRINEFFSGEEVTTEYKAVGFFLTSILEKTSKELENIQFNEALYYKRAFAHAPTIYAIALFEDRIDIAMSPIGDYPNHMLQMARVPLEDVNEGTQGAVKLISEEIPEIANDLVSTDTEVRAQAKIELFRFLAKKKPENVKEAFGLALIYGQDKDNYAARINIEEIPESDGILGEVVVIYKEGQKYKNKDIGLTRAEFDEMSTEKIKILIEKLPPNLRKLVIGRNSEDYKAGKIFELLEKAGYKGNAAQKKWEKFNKVSSAFVRYESALRERILNSIIEGKNAEDAKLDKKSLDELYRSRFNELGAGTIDEVFSITDAIDNRTSLDDLKI